VLLPKTHALGDEGEQIAAFGYPRQRELDRFLILSEDEARTGDAGGAAQRGRARTAKKPATWQSAFDAHDLFSGGCATRRFAESVPSGVRSFGPAAVALVGFPVTRGGSLGTPYVARTQRAPIPACDGFVPGCRSTLLAALLKETSRWNAPFTMCRCRDPGDASARLIHEGLISPHEIVAVFGKT
jgi:hypothetical protein